MTYNRGKNNRDREATPNSQQDWRRFLEQLKKDKNKFYYDLLQDCGISENQDLSLTIYVPNTDKENQVKTKIGKIKSNMPLHWQNRKINVAVGKPPESVIKPPDKKIIKTPTRQSNLGSSTSHHIQIENPLQTLNFTEFGVDKNKKELPQPVLQAAVDADGTCGAIYNYLTERTKKLANIIVEIKFPWRVRVGGMRGFRELLLPAFHPVYGIPYIPSSSLKGAVRAAALKLKLDSESEVKRLLGTLEDGMGCVQILDAFPTEPCLSVDMANPQWHWTENQVKYEPVPHPLLSMECPEFVVGLAYTSRSTNSNDLQNVKDWLEQAVDVGLGSRISAGYGRASLNRTLPHSSLHNFQLLTQGMYGADTQNPEFRPVALRGVLRYWFRAFALSIYPPSQCKKLENSLFGTIESKSEEGSIRIAVEWTETRSNQAYLYEGTILLEAQTQPHLTLIEKLLQISSHIGGIGRGSRRPLHWNSPRLRGCYWELTNTIILCNERTWRDFFTQLRTAFINVQSPDSSPVLTNTDSPRCQDIFNTNARMYLVPHPDLKHPTTVKDWEKQGHTPEVRGKALELLYSSPKYKGVNREGKGNAEVGGKLGIPSYVIIKSNFPNSEQAYQTVTIFGTDNNQRQNFVEALPKNSVRVW
jgi:CRISPR-associated protein Cmr6